MVRMAIEKGGLMNICEILEWYARRIVVILCFYILLLCVGATLLVGLFCGGFGLKLPGLLTGKENGG